LRYGVLVSPIGSFPKGGKKANSSLVDNKKAGMGSLGKRGPAGGRTQEKKKRAHLSDYPRTGPASSRGEGYGKKKVVHRAPINERRSGGGVRRIGNLRPAKNWLQGRTLDHGLKWKKRIRRTVQT